MKNKIKQLEQLKDELNLKTIQNFRRGKGEGGKDMHYTTIAKNIKRGVIDSIEIDGETFISDLP